MPIVPSVLAPVFTVHRLQVRNAPFASIGALCALFVACTSPTVCILMLCIQVLHPGMELSRNILKAS